MGLTGNLCPLHKVETIAALFQRLNKLCMFSLISLLKLSSPPTRLPSSAVCWQRRVTGVGLHTSTTAVIDCLANNSYKIELARTTSICFLHYDFELRRADCLFIQLGTCTGVTMGPSSFTAGMQGSCTSTQVNADMGCWSSASIKVPGSYCEPPAALLGGVTPVRHV